MSSQIATPSPGSAGSWAWPAAGPTPGGIGLEAPGKRAAKNTVITAEIAAVIQEHRGFYGSPRIHQELVAADRRVGRHRVARLMQRAELRARTPQAIPALQQGQTRCLGSGGEPAAAGLPAPSAEPPLGG
jgi:hypothetical protein